MEPSVLGPRLPRVERIAVLRANGIGDLVLALPALEALRAAYPEAELTLLGRAWHADFLPGRGPIDRALAVPASRGVNGGPDVEEDPAALDAFFSAMRAERFDLAVQLHGGGGFSNPFTRRLGASTSIGLRAPGAPGLDREVPYVYWQHEVLRYLEVAALVGAPPVGLEPRLQATPADRAASLRAVPDAPGPLVVLAPGATDARRWWPTRHFAALADALVEEHGARVAVCGAAHERPLGDEVAAAMRHPAELAFGTVDLGGLAGLLARADLVVANDSGPLHLAGAVGAATVGIYWCGILPAAGPLTLTRHRPLVSWRLRCPACGAEGMPVPCEHFVSFVADVPVADALEHARELLQA